MFGADMTRANDCNSTPDAWAPAETETHQRLQSVHARGAGYAGTCSSQGPYWGAWT